MKILFITKSSYPTIGPGTIQLLRFLDSINGIGVDPIIIGRKGTTCFDGKYPFIAATILPFKYPAAVIRRVFPDLMYAPDPEVFTYNPFAVKKAMKSVRWDDIDIIHSVSFPCSAHLTALKLKMKTGKPWIAQFYDPWVDNCFRHFDTNFFKNLDLAHERSVAENADAIIHTNSTIIDVWAKRYGEDIRKKCFVLPMTYEKEKYEKASLIQPKENTSKIIISHIGGLWGSRTINDIVYALNIVKKDYANLEDLMEVRLIGDVRTNDAELVKKYRLDGVFNFVGLLPKEKLTQYYLASDAFVVVDAPQKNNVFFPSKLLDYFYYKRFIIGITPHHGATAELLNDSQNIAFRNGDVEGLASFYRNMITDNTILLGNDIEYYKKFSSQRQAEIYSRVLEFINCNRK